MGLSRIWNSYGKNPGELMDQIDGFPAHTADYENGVAVREMSLDSITEKDLEPRLFTAPDGYRREDPYHQPWRSVVFRLTRAVDTEQDRRIELQALGIDGFLAL